MVDNVYLPGQQKRAKFMRYDTAEILKRFFFCEQSLIITQAGWLANIAPLEVKTTLPQIIWEDAMTANAMRQRIFELYYPSRLIEVDAEAPLLQLLAEVRNAPSALALIWSLTDVFKPALLRAYQTYLDFSDSIGDGPSIRFMDLAVHEKVQQIEKLRALIPLLIDAEQGAQAEAKMWVSELEQRLSAMGGIGLNPVKAKSGKSTPFPGRKSFVQPPIPVRDQRFHRLRFYWPDIIDETYPYGTGLQLQLRSAISHLNEIWAVEMGGAILHAFADQLGWEFVFDAARWTYDESRHCRMGYERLAAWGFERPELPLGTYIYEAALSDPDPIYRIAMLFFFETKNIGKKKERIRQFIDYSDNVSHHDMDFDWADETIHASYGKKWLIKLLELRKNDHSDLEIVRKHCGALVQAIVNTATDEERTEIRSIADGIVIKAEHIAASNADNQTVTDVSA